MLNHQPIRAWPSASSQSAQVFRLKEDSATPVRPLLFNASAHEETFLQLKGSVGTNVDWLDRYRAIAELDALRADFHQMTDAVANGYQLEGSEEMLALAHQVAQSLNAPQAENTGEWVMRLAAEAVESDED